MNDKNKKARVIAYYLPQFHPIPENDEWWGKGFTEWTNVGKAKPLFKGHYQPRVPADLGYYDLRVPETRQAQADMAQKYGIEGFAYWHYWFGNGKRLLERPFNEVLASGEPDFPFCLAWANESWKGFDHGLFNRRVLIEQCYPGDKDYINHFNALLPAFEDRRYIKVDGKPIFIIYKPYQLPDPSHFIKLWQDLAKQNGLGKIHFVAHLQFPNERNVTEDESYKEMLSLGFESVNFVRLTAFIQNRTLFERVKGKAIRIFSNTPFTYPYKKAIYDLSNPIDKNENVFPSIIPGWDHTPRSGNHGLVLNNSTPELFSDHIFHVLNNVKLKQFEKRLIFLKSWNEWAEGNYVEPDLRWGKKYLEVIKQCIIDV